jgi:hypothetical protein
MDAPARRVADQRIAVEVRAYGVRVAFVAARRVLARVPVEVGRSGPLAVEVGPGGHSASRSGRPGPRSSRSSACRRGRALALVALIAPVLPSLPGVPGRRSRPPWRGAEVAAPVAVAAADWRSCAGACVRVPRVLASI